LLRENRCWFAVATVILFLTGVFLIAIRKSLRVEYQLVEQIQTVRQEYRWKNGSHCSAVLEINSTINNASIFIGHAHYWEIPYFNITPGPVTIVIRSVVTNILYGPIHYNTTPLDLSSVAGDFVPGIISPSSPVLPSPSLSYSEVNITVYYEGVNSTIRFMYSF
jgi:hypothetical protein